MSTHLAAGRVLVYFEGSRDGVVAHRSTLSSNKVKTFDAALLDLGPGCRSGLEM